MESVIKFVASWTSSSTEDSDNSRSTSRSQSANESKSFVSKLSNFLQTSFDQDNTEKVKPGLEELLSQSRKLDELIAKTASPQASPDPSQLTLSKHNLTDFKSRNTNCS